VIGDLMNLLLRLVADSALAEPSATRILRTLDDTYLRRGVSLSIMVVCCLVLELFCRSNFSHLRTNLQDVISPKVDAQTKYQQSNTDKATTANVLKDLEQTLRHSLNHVLNTTWLILQMIKCFWLWHMD
jgi:hypothetical protein